MDAPDTLVAGRYRLRNRIGAGGMGVVWEAWDERLQRRVALKLLHRQPTVDPLEAELANRRAMREARITARLHHRFAVPIFDVVEHDGQACLVMPFLPSITLAAALRDGGPLSPSEAAHAGMQIASALTEAHRLGIVHRDVKPGNILITEDGAALISDFGIAHALGDASLTTTGMVHGTPAYLAPEVARGAEATYASDVFSLGGTLYSALEGRPPFGTDHNSIALLHRVAAGQIEPPQHCGPLTPLVGQMLAADPDQRPTMAAVARALTALSAEPAQPQQPSTLPLPAAVLGGTPSPPWTPAGGYGEPAPEPERPASPGPVPPVLAPAAAPVWSEPDGRRRPDRRRIVLVLVVGGAIAVAALAAVLWQVLPSGSNTAGAGGAASTVTQSSQPAHSSPAASPSAAKAPATHSTSPTAVPQPSHSPSPSRPSSQGGGTPSSGPGTPTAAQLASAISSYYALMPGGTDQAWPRMTAGYQASHAGGRQAYQNFWHAIRGVSASDVTGRPPDTAEATITYDYKNGRVVRERTRYRLINDGGVLRIAESTVLSSSTS